MWQMTIKQRRRHSELMREFDQLKRDPYLQVPADYQPGASPEEDAKYQSVQEKFKQVVEEIHALEQAVRDRT